MEARKLSGEKRLNLRFKVLLKAEVFAQLLGSSARYEFLSESISASGLVVRHAPGLQHAFNSHSILEVWLKVNPEQSIYFLAKYIRKASEDSFAMQIVDLDRKNQKLLVAFLDTLTPVSED